MTTQQKRKYLKDFYTTYGDYSEFAEISVAPDSIIETKYEELKAVA